MQHIEFRRFYLIGGKMTGKHGRYWGDQLLGKGATEEKLESEMGRDRQQSRESREQSERKTKRERLKVGRAPLKGNKLNVYRWYFSGCSRRGIWLETQGQASTDS